MTRTANNYQISSDDGHGNHWIVPVARLDNAAQTGVTLALNHYPTLLISRLLGVVGKCGTVLSQETINGVDCVVVDFHRDQVFYHLVRNVRTYNNHAANHVELTWGVINIGDPIYYDRNAHLVTLPAGCFLSTSPLSNYNDHGAAANVLFGFAVYSNVQTMPTTIATGSTESIAVMQI
jgi:hypothetical protein